MEFRTEVRILPPPPYIVSFYALTISYKIIQEIVTVKDVTLYRNSFLLCCLRKGRDAVWTKRRLEDDGIGGACNTHRLVERYVQNLVGTPKVVDLSM